MAEHNELGKEGEEKAREYLSAKGYRIRHFNWVPTGSKNELDIIAEKDNMLIVVEVKSRSTEFFEHPKDAITPAKIRRIVQATHDYIQTFNLNCETRFDVIAAFPQKDGAYKIEHIEDAFMPPIN
jgi:putative endonuclease